MSTSFGFGNAPITRALLCATAGSSVVIQAVRAARRPVPHYVAAWEQVFAFRYPGELLFGVGLLYYFRFLERHYGSPKFGGRVLTTSVLAGLLQLSASAALGWRSASGPFGVIFGCFLPFASDVPPLQRFHLLGLRLSDKTFVYAAGLQLLLSAPRTSTPAGVSGLLAGLIYHLEFLGLKRLRLPRWACVLLGQPSARAVVQHAGMLRPPQQQRRVARQQQPAAQQPPEPSPEGIAQLTSMGFDESRAAQALQQVGNDVNAAIALLV